MLYSLLLGKHRGQFEKIYNSLVYGTLLQRKQSIDCIDFHQIIEINYRHILITKLLHFSTQS